MRRFAAVMILFAIPECAETVRAQAVCHAGTVASYAGTSCVKGDVTYTFPTDDYTFSGSGIAPIPASAVLIRMDPNGPYTLLFSSPDWALSKPHQSFSIDIKFQVSGATVTAGWQHGAETTEDAKVSESTTVQGNPAAVSSSFRTASDGADRAAPASFPGGAHDVVVNISASTGERGTASLRSYGTHFGRWEDVRRRRSGRP
ncbi:MAG TPA: hypothetical protein VL523_01115 [Terriglobia bacterium]|nr:hypothetical protein [Terriglobia bacterium]